MKFRTLRANEIDCRIAAVAKGGYGLSLLLYKDARVDQNILDETVGAMNWQRHHSRNNANCIVSIWDEEKGLWVEKEDTGTESNTEKEKGQASDSFKRACFNWGIGRELYSAPFIWIGSDKCKLLNDQGKWVCRDKFRVDKIQYDDNRNICALEIYNTTQNIRCYVYTNMLDKAPNEPSKLTYRDKVLVVAEDKGISAQELARDYGLTASTTEARFKEVLEDLEGKNAGSN